jgi:hypothetical protein
MKKFLLSFAITAAVFSGKAQSVLNEVYTDPNAGKHEFFELYNSSGIGKQSVDCFQILAFFKEGSNYGWYVLDLPTGDSVPAKGYYVGAAADPFNVQSQTTVTADWNWNAPAAGASLKKYINNGGPLNGYTDVSGTIPANFNDVFQPTNGLTHKYTVLIYVNGAFSNGLTGGERSGVLDAIITSMPTLTVPISGIGCVANLVANFSALTVVEGAQPAVGTDNGYIRTRDGLCGSWDKSSSSVNHTPGATNGSAAGLTGSLTTTESNIICYAGAGPAQSRIQYSVTGFTGDVTLLADFPIKVQFYRDMGTLGQLDGSDVPLGAPIQVNNPAATIYNFDFNQTYSLIIVYQTKRGCFDKVVSRPNGCINLPVSFKSFTATRTNRSNVVVRWETATEQNAAGFTVERNIKGNWEYVTYIPTQAQGGNSTSVLSYQVNDLNAAKGISQYRIRQVDLDAVEKLSEIRSVRGEGQTGTTIVYPNPSTDGKANVVFQGEFAKRDVTVQDMSGRIIKQWRNYTNNNIQIDNLTPGFYTIRILNTETGEQNVEKLVVNNR